MSVLQDICDRKRRHILQKQSGTSLEDLKSISANTPPPCGFIRALSAKSRAIIAEIKKASPSKGVIRTDFDAPSIAKTYEDNGAACLSVLTDEPYFQGHDDYLRAIRNTVSLPLLRKDFMLDPYQIYESRALGADCILLIMAALETSQAQELYSLSQELGMDVLVEIHDAEELEEALKLKPSMIGINNRNLKTLEVDIQTSFDLSSKIPSPVLKIAESGISDRETLLSLQSAGFDGFLIGESLMREEDIGDALQKLLN